MIFSFYIARRYLRSRRHSRFLSGAGIIAIFGITLGVMVLDLTLAIMNGFHAEMRRSFVDSMPMITVVTSAPGGFSDLGAVMDTIGAVEGVIGVAPFIRQEVVITSSSLGGRQRHRGAVAWGIEPSLQESVTPLSDQVWPGSVVWKKLQSMEDGTPGVVLGSELGTALFSGLGDTVIITAPSGEVNLDSIEAESRRYVVIGFLDTGMYEFDSRFLYVDLPEARHFFGYSPGGATGIGVKVADMMQAPQIADDLVARLGRHYFANDWIDLNRNLFQWIKIEKVGMFLLLAMIVLVAAANIIGILTMMVGERQREIGIMLSMGARRSQVQGIFILDGLTLGLIGTGLGSLLGYLGTVLLRKYGFRLPSDVYFIDHLPVVAQWGDFLLVIAVTIAITLLATLIPSWVAARLKPMEIIRYT
jgi:lipoprotein-releasing system permease protein